MNDMLQQLGLLVLGSVPTMVLFLATLVAYRLLVHIPLTKILSKRYDLTQGAIERALVAIAAAESKTTEYERRLRAARAEVFRQREQSLRGVHVESDRVLTEVRKNAQQRGVVARLAIEENIAEARTRLDASIYDLSSRVIRTVLPTAKASSQEQSR